MLVMTIIVTMKRWLRRLLLLALAAVFSFAGVSWLSAQRLTGAHRRAVGNPPKDFPFPIESIKFTTRDEHTLSGWLMPAEKSDCAVVLLHGYGGDRRSMLPRAKSLRALGYTALLYDARACGESSGERITFGYREREDLLAAVKLLKERGHRNIACLGVSQGGATILFAAEELKDVKCVICESAYDEMTHAVDRRTRRFGGVPGWFGASLLVPFAESRLALSIDEVRPVDYIAKLPCPVFIMSGDRDTRTWPEDTRRLFEAAREPKELWMIDGAGHEDLFRHVGYEEKMRAYLKRHFE